MRQTLLKGSQSGSLLFITEVCFCGNFLRLPYMLEYDGSEVQWKETEYHGTFTGTSSEVVSSFKFVYARNLGSQTWLEVHIAATAPGESAASFTTGAVFTQALYSIDPIQTLSLKQIAKRLQENVNEILPAAYSQHPRIYCSNKIDEPHFFAALGFCAPSVGMGADSDSSE
ncbi:unnamed protein product [Rhizoctonia solani]|uniref:Uncharacterized protein n=1 Tax=Rhizoctonia solani TaxID=456999 RepID=A0A8H3GFX8_9AGAM|nr:unnamed protein product [Rhizoctonia solani]